MIAQPGVFDFLLAVAQPVPRIIFLLADDFLETATDKEFHSVETGLIHVTQDRMHHARRHIVRPETGVAVSQSRIDDADLFHGDLLRGRSRLSNNAR